MNSPGGYPQPRNQSGVNTPRGPNSPQRPSDNRQPGGLSQNFAAPQSGPFNPQQGRPGMPPQHSGPGPGLRQGGIPPIVQKYRQNENPNFDPYQNARLQEIMARRHAMLARQQGGFPGQGPQLQGAPPQAGPPGGPVPPWVGMPQMGPQGPQLGPQGFPPQMPPQFPHQPMPPQPPPQFSPYRMPPQMGPQMGFQPQY